MFKWMRYYTITMNLHWMKFFSTSLPYINEVVVWQTDDFIMESCNWCVHADTSVLVLKKCSYFTVSNIIPWHWMSNDMKQGLLLCYFLNFFGKIWLGFNFFIFLLFHELLTSSRNLVTITGFQIFYGWLVHTSCDWSKLFPYLFVLGPQFVI